MEDKNQKLPSTNINWEICIFRKVDSNHWKYWNFYIEIFTFLIKWGEIMGKVILICGKICSGKSYYANQLKNKLNAVIISPDEATYELINNEQGEFYNIFSEKLNKYLTRKVGEIAEAGANVIFERGFWSSKDRKAIRDYYNENNVECEIHYVCVDDETWKQNIEERNKKVLEGKGGSDFYLDEGLMKKLETSWEEPTEEEYDVIYKVERK